ncbi:MAG: enoyl-CoA hydratase/carnithine racemase [Gammaproteobacteria bacterium]|jgi:enoyl-CoA hydratase/carnithine racemase
MSYEAITLDVDDAVGIITLNRPERMNAWTHQMGLELGQALGECDQNDTVRAVVITGAGRAFCAGADLNSGGDTFAGRAGEEPADAPPSLLPNDIGKPVIAALNGAAVGVGITMPMLCDMRIVAADAKVSFAFTRRGMIPEFTSHYMVQRLAGFAVASDVLLSGRMFSGAELAALGLANQALPSNEVLPEALRRAQDFVNTAPVSVAITKRLLWESVNGSRAEFGKREDALFAWVGNQPDAREGIESFLEKRAPSWKMSARHDLPDDL